MIADIVIYLNVPAIIGGTIGAIVAFILLYIQYRMTMKAYARFDAEYDEREKRDQKIDQDFRDEIEQSKKRQQELEKLAFNAQAAWDNLLAEAQVKQ